MSIELPDLPYAENALAPHISDRTLQFHYGKHHASYVANLNRLLEDGPLKGQPLEMVVRATCGDGGSVAIFNNAAQVWNHTFYWNSMRARRRRHPFR